MTATAPTTTTTKTMSYEDARIIFDLSATMTQQVAAQLFRQGWDVREQYDCGQWSMWADREHEGRPEMFSVTVERDGTTNIVGDAPTSVHVLAHAMAPIVPAYLEANEQW